MTELTRSEIRKPGHPSACSRANYGRRVSTLCAPIVTLPVHLRQAVELPFHPWLWPKVHQRLSTKGLPQRSRRRAVQRSDKVDLRP